MNGRTGGKDYHCIGLKNKRPCPLTTETEKETTQSQAAGCHAPVEANTHTKIMLLPQSLLYYKRQVAAKSASYPCRRKGHQQAASRGVHVRARHSPEQFQPLTINKRKTTTSITHEPHSRIKNDTRKTTPPPPPCSPTLPRPHLPYRIACVSFAKYSNQNLPINFLYHTLFRPFHQENNKKNKT